MVSTIVGKDEAMTERPATPRRWLLVSEERTMPRFFIVTAAVVTIFAVLAVIAAVDQTAVSAAIRIIAQR
jgi:hypothetical protein